jgi:hypothetical protein
MRKFLKRVVLAIGVIVIIGAIVFCVIGGMEVGNLAKDTTSNALMWEMLTAACALVGGLLVGFGLGTPSQGFKERYQRKQAEDAAKAAPEAQ